MTAAGPGDSVRGEWARRALLGLHWVAGLTVCALILLGGEARLAGTGFGLLRDVLPFWPEWWAALAGGAAVLGAVGQVTGRPWLALAGAAGLAIWYLTAAGSLAAAWPGRRVPAHPIAVYATLAGMATIHALVLRDKARADRSGATRSRT